MTNADVIEDPAIYASTTALIAVPVADETHTIGVELAGPEHKVWLEDRHMAARSVTGQCITRRRNGVIVQVFVAMGTFAELDDLARLWAPLHLATYVEAKYWDIDPSFSDEDRVTAAATEHRHEFIRALRDLAEFLTEHPEVPVPTHSGTILASIGGDSVDAARVTAQSAQTFGVPVKIMRHNGDVHMDAVKQFGPDDYSGIEYRVFHIDRPTQAAVAAAAPTPDAAGAL